MGLIGVDGKGWRYSGCKMCPARAVSIFKTLMGRRLAWREGSAGETELCTDCWLIFAAPFSPEEQLSHAGFVLFLRTETVGDVLMTQFSWKWLRNTCGRVKKTKTSQRHAGKAFFLLLLLPEVQKRNNVKSFRETRSVREEESSRAASSPASL